MKITSKLFLHETLLGSREVMTPFINIAGYDCPDNEFCKKIERDIALEFLLNTRSKIYLQNYMLKKDEIKGVLHFLRIKSSQLAKTIGITRSAISNAVLGNKKISVQLSILLLDCVEKELLFKNYFIKYFNDSVSVEKDDYYFKQLSTAYNQKLVA